MLGPFALLDQSSYSWSEGELIDYWLSWHDFNAHSARRTWDVGCARVVLDRQAEQVR